MPWATFRELFLEKYFPEEEKDQREKEFMELTQGNLTVREYTTQFERLSRFARHMVDTPQKKVKKFHRGLTPHLRHMTLAQLSQPFEALVRLAAGLEKDGCQARKQNFTRPPPPRFNSGSRQPSTQF